MIFLLILTIISAILCYSIRSITVFKRQGIPQCSITFAAIQTMNFVFQRRSVAEIAQFHYNKFPHKRYCGIYPFGVPILMIRDPDLIKELTVKCFDSFPDHTQIFAETLEPLWARNLFALKGQNWRNMRQILSPSYTSSKMRTIFVLISECAKNFSNYYLEANKNIIEVELNDSFTRFANDIIATTAFGIETDSLKIQDNQFYRMGTDFANFSKGFINIVKFIALVPFPKIAKIFKLSIFKKEIIRFFIDIIDNTVKIRREKGIVRPDMIHLLMEAQNGSQIKEERVEDSGFAVQNESDLGNGIQQKELTNMDIAAQALIFFFAGFQSVAGLMSFMGYELATNPNIQKRLRDEIEETLVNCGVSLTYEALLKMKYMDMVVSESLRKWPPVVAIDRQCIRPYTIKPKLPGEKPIHLKPKQIIWIPLYGIHRDPDIYPEPERFDPERFNDENKGNIKPYTYIPFGSGPRNCIGSRFALLEIKTVFFYLLHNFELVPTKKSIIPVKLLKGGFTVHAEGGFWFGLKKLNK